MDKRYAIKESTLDNLAAKVRTLRDSSELLTPNRMAEEIEAAATELVQVNDSLKAAIEGVGEIYTDTPTSVVDYKFRLNTQLTSVTLPNVTSIGEYAFTGCSSLTNAIIPNVLTIGNYAFHNCTLLTSADFPKATSIGTYAFRSCTSLTSADFVRATSIGTYAFYGCTSLTNLIIPDVNAISDHAFYNCTSLTSADFMRATSIGPYAFYNCISLTSADFPKATSIGDDAFYGCSLLENVNFPRVTSLGSYAFQRCTELREIDLDAVTGSIGMSTFNGCSSLNTLILRELSILNLSTSSALLNTPIASGDGYVYVPSALVSEYVAHTYWGAYNIRAIEDYPDIMGYKWEKFGPKVEYVLTWDGATVAETTSQYASVGVYPGYNFDKQTGELTIAGTLYYAEIADLTTGNYRLVGGEVQRFASSQASGEQYRIVWRKPRISEIAIPGTEVSYGYVTSRDPNRYPDNGGAEDGYRYIKVTGGAE